MASGNRDRHVHQTCTSSLHDVPTSRLTTPTGCFQSASRYRTVRHSFATERSVIRLLPLYPGTQDRHSNWKGSRGRRSLAGDPPRGKEIAAPARRRPTRPQPPRTADSFLASRLPRVYRGRLTGDWRTPSTPFPIPPSPAGSSGGACTPESRWRIPIYCERSSGSSAIDDAALEPSGDHLRCISRGRTSPAIEPRPARPGSALYRLVFHVRAGNGPPVTDATAHGHRRRSQSTKRETSPRRLIGGYGLPMHLRPRRVALRNYVADGNGRRRGPAVILINCETPCRPRRRGKPRSLAV